ncbi:hypothetical protein BH11ARM1_BH11ARM1_04730 [soil metagenome]
MGFYLLVLVICIANCGWFVYTIKTSSAQWKALYGFAETMSELMIVNSPLPKRIVSNWRRLISPSLVALIIGYYPTFVSLMVCVTINPTAPTNHIAGVAVLVLWLGMLIYGIGFGRAMPNRHHGN